ncbi:MAG: hypothetical protein ACLRR3_00910 [Eubacterium sp.]
MALAIFIIIVEIITKEPNKNAATKTILILPRKGKVIIELRGLINDSNSNPKKLPNKAPKIQEKNSCGTNYSGKIHFLVL